MQRNIDYGKSSTILSSIALVSILLFGLLAMSGFANVRDNMPVLPTESEFKQMMADEIANIEFPEMPVFPDYPEVDTSKLDELWEGVYSDDVEELEDASFIESVYQFFDDNNYLEILEVQNSNFFVGENDVVIQNIDNLFVALEKQIYFEEDDELFDFLVEEYEDESEGLIRVQFIREYEDDREFNVINLGLDDEDDREVELSSVIRVKIFLDEDDDTEYEFEKVYINSVVTSDDEVLEAEIAYTI